MTLCPTCGNRMAFHDQYHQWYCPMCNASQIKEALRNHQSADFHNRSSQSFFPGVPTSLQATQQSLEDSSPFSGSLYCSMPPTLPNQNALPPPQELAMAMWIQQYYQMMQQQGYMPVAAEQQQAPQQQIIFTKPPSNLAQDNGVPPQYPWWPAPPQTAPEQAGWPVAPAQYMPNQYASPQFPQQQMPPQQPLDLLDDEISCLFTAAVDGKMPTLDGEPYYINQYETDNSSYLGKVKLETKTPLGFYANSHKVDVYITPYRLCYTFTPYANVGGAGSTGKGLAAMIQLGSWLWSKAKKRKAGACSWFKIDMRGRSFGSSEVNEVNTDIYAKNKHFSFLTLPFLPFSLPVIIYRIIRPKKYIYARVEYTPSDKKFSFLHRIRKEIRLSPKRSDFPTWDAEIEDRVLSAREITLEDLSNFYSGLDIELSKTNKDYIF